MAPAEVGVGRMVDLDLSFKHACLVFFSISIYYVLQYEHQPTVLNFGHVGPIETPGSRDRRGPDPRSREDSPLDGTDGWMDGYGVRTSGSDKKRRQSRPRARWRLRKRTANARRRRQKRDAK